MNLVFHFAIQSSVENHFVNAKPVTRMTSAEGGDQTFILARREIVLIPAGFAQ